MDLVDDQPLLTQVVEDVEADIPEEMYDFVLEAIQYLEGKQVRRVSSKLVPHVASIACNVCN